MMIMRSIKVQTNQKKITKDTDRKSRTDHDHDHDHSAEINPS